MADFDASRSPAASQRRSFCRTAYRAELVQDVLRANPGLFRQRYPGAITGRFRGLIVTIRDAATIDPATGLMRSIAAYDGAGLSGRVFRVALGDAEERAFDQFYSEETPVDADRLARLFDDACAAAQRDPSLKTDADPVSAADGLVIQLRTASFIASGTLAALFLTSFAGGAFDESAAPLALFFGLGATALALSILVPARVLVAASGSGDDGARGGAAEGTTRGG